MSNYLVKFNEKTIRTVFDENGNVWFFAVDVCNAIGILNARSTTSRLDDDVKKLVDYSTCNIDMYSTKLSQLNPGQKITIINELGLYNLILSSRKSSAKSISKEILLQIKDYTSIIRALSDFEIPNDLPDMFVYAIRNTVTKNIKLGISRNPQERLKQLQTGNDCKLEIVAIREAKNRFADESALHNSNNSFLIRGEWFSEEVANCLN